jgi:hypothetical protein
MDIGDSPHCFTDIAWIDCFHMQSFALWMDYRPVAWSLILQTLHYDQKKVDGNLA